MPHIDESSREAPPPVLRFISTKKVLAHEEPDAQRYEPLIDRIVESNVWLHPPVVAPLPNTKGYFVVLDGANRCHAVSSLHFPHILVQIVSYESGQVSLDTWSHIVSELPVQNFVGDIEAIDGVSVHQTDRLSAQANLAQRSILAYIVDFAAIEKVYAIHISDHSLHWRNTALRALVNTYKTHGKLDRLNESDPKLARELFPKATAMLVFPHYEPAEIMVAARDNEPLPPGISRHIIQGRAMRLNYPLEELRDTMKPLEDKNRDLAAWVLERIAERSVRFYAESTYLFDE
jgi:hypothetical protein